MLRVLPARGHSFRTNLSSQARPAKGSLTFTPEVDDLVSQQVAIPIGDADHGPREKNLTRARTGNSNHSGETERATD
jgi:hypothetical protein